MPIKTRQQVEQEAARDSADAAQIAFEAFRSWEAQQVRLRQQLDNHDAMTQECGLRCPPEENKTRQEFREEADINSIVARFYPFAPPTNPVQYGEQDMGLDLHTAMLSMQGARDAYGSMPSSLRDTYPTFNDFLQAFMDGRVVITPSGEDSAGSTAEAAPEAASESAPAKAD